VQWQDHFSPTPTPFLPSHETPQALPSSPYLPILMMMMMIMVVVVVVRVDDHAFNHPFIDISSAE